MFGKRKLSGALFVAAALVLLLPAIGFCLLAQEVTQQAILKAAENEVEQLKKMIEHQKNMLAHLDDSTVNDIKSKRNTLINNFKDVRKILTQSDVITHLTDDLENKLKSRHPEWKSGLSINDLKKRNEDRDKSMRSTIVTYLNGINLAAQDFKSDDELRSKLMDTLKSPKGQTQAIQALGALLDHANLMLVRNENTLQSMMTAYLEYERDAIDKREQKGKSILEACGGLKSYKPKATSYKVGF
jgi:P-type conjugative transfer protein TrbJ